ncbi:MAG: hypothetical protein ACRD37_13885, partial [Candidatus Acidiferrales bacterium]
MSTETSEKRQLGKLVNVARLVALLLALLALKETPNDGATSIATIFLAAYFLVSIVVVAVERAARFRRIPFPPEIDAVALAVFIGLTPSLGPFWLFYLFAVFALAALGRTGNSKPFHQLLPGSLFAMDAAWLSAGAAVAVAIRAAWFPSAGEQGILRSIGIVAGTYCGGLCVAWLGMRERTLLSEDRFIES